MAEEKDSSCHNNYCASDPNFAIICSFFDRFATTCGISHPTFIELQEMIENCQEIAPELIDLHVKLLRKIRKSVATEKWERALIKFCHSYYCNEEGWELERGGYKKCKVPLRLKILKTLLDAQFDLNSKFKTDINKFTAEELRLDPLGRDKVGQSYWCQFDPAANVRVYKEDQDEETWKLVAKDREGLVDLITQLSSGEELLGLELLNEDSNSEEVEKPITDTGQVVMSTSEENTTDNVSSIDNNIENGLKKEDHVSFDNHIKKGLCAEEDSKSSGDTSENQMEQIDKTLPRKESSNVNEKHLLKLETEKDGKPSEATISTAIQNDGKCSEITSTETEHDGKCFKASEASLSTENDGKCAVQSQSTSTKSKSLQNEDHKNMSYSKLELTKDVDDNSMTKFDSLEESNKNQTKNVIEDEDNTHIGQVSETDRINVAEEIKQRSLSKSNSFTSFKGKVSKSLLGSKLDQIFSHKLESKSFISKSLTSDTKPSSHHADETEIDLGRNKSEELSHKVTTINNDSLNENNKRPNEEESSENPHKKQALEKELDEEVGEEIEEPVMFIKGEGSGHDCDTGNPGLEKEESTETNQLNNVTCNKSIVNTLGEHQKTSDYSNYNPTDVVGQLSRDINRCLVDKNEESLFGDVDKAKESHKINENPCKSSETLNGNNELSDSKINSTNHKENVDDQCNSHSDAENNKSIEEQMSFLTGESLSPKECSDEGKNDNCFEKDKPKAFLNCTNTSKDIEAKSPNGKTEKVENVSSDVLNSVENKSYSIDLIDTLMDKQNILTDNKLNIDTEEFCHSSKKTVGNISEESKEDFIDKHNTKNLNSKESKKDKINEENEKCLNIKTSMKTTSTPAERDSGSKKCVEDAEEHMLLKQDKIACNDSASESVKNAETEHVLDCSEKDIITDDRSTEQIDGSAEKSDVNNDKGNIEESALCENSNKPSGDDNSGDKSLVTGIEELDNDNEIIKCNENEKTPNQKAPSKKSPKPRKKVFTPKSRKRMKKGSTNTSPKDDNNEIASQEKNDVNEKNVEEEKEVSTESLKQDVQNDEESKVVRGTRKRRSSRRNTGTEKDSEEDNVSDRQQVDEEHEVGGKRMKLKGKRTQNKSLRKSVEEKLKSKSSSEEDEENSKSNEGKGTVKKSSSLKPKHVKGQDTIKSGRKKKNSSAAKLKESDEESDEKEDSVQASKKVKKTKSQGRNSRAYLGIDLNVDINVSSRSVRQSSRLAQIKIKEQADHKAVDERHQKPDKSSKKNKKKNENEEKQKGTPKKQKRTKAKSSDEEIQDEEVEKKKRRRKKKKNPVKAFNERDPWKSSSGSSTEVEEEEEEYHFDDIVEEEEELPVNVKSDHEFSPESDLEGDEDVKPIRHARTAQKDPSVEESEADDFACEKCGNKDHPEWILLCDTCDKGWHASCLRPSLMLVPEGDWHCPPCQHAVLVKKLQETLKIFDRDSKRRENEELRKKRLAYVGISLDNVLPNAPPKEKTSGSESSESEESGSESESEGSDEPVYQLRQRRQGTNTYRFSEFDELINSAIQDEVEGKNAVYGVVSENANKVTAKVEGESNVNEIKVEETKEINGVDETKPDPSSDDKKEETPKKPVKKDKDKSDEDESSEEDEEEDEEEEEEFPHVVPKRVNTLPKPGKKKHRRLNCLDDASDDDDGSDEDFKGSSSEEEEDDEEGESSDESTTGRRRSKRGHLEPVRRSSRTRRSRFDKEFINDDSDESDAPKRKKTRKLWTESDTESDDSTWGRKKKKKNHGSSGRGKFKKNKKFTIEDELSETESSKTPKKKRQRKVKYGGLDDLAVEDLPSRRTRGKKINYQEVIGSDSDEEILKKKSSRKAIIDDEDEFVAEKEDKEESESVTDDDEEDNSSDDADVSKEEIVKDKKEAKEEKAKNDSPKAKTPPVLKPAVEDKSGNARRIRPPKAMIAPPPERLISEDEQYKAIVSKVSTMSHSEKPFIETDNKLIRPVNFNDHSNSSSESRDLSDQPHILTPIKIPNMPLDPKFIKRSPPIKIRSGVPVNAGGRKSPLASPTSELAFFPGRTGNPELVHSPPGSISQKNMGLIQAATQQFMTSRKAVGPTVKSEKSTNEDTDNLDDEDFMEDIEEEEDEEEDESEDDLLEEGEIPKKVARKMARMEERMMRQQEDKRNEPSVKPVVSAPLSPGAVQPPSASEQKPLLRVVSPLKLMANPPGSLQSSFMHSGMPPRMPMSSPLVPSRMSMALRPPQPAGMMNMDDGSPKRRGRGRGKKQLGQEKQEEIMGGGSVIRGMLQQPQSYPPAHYPQQYPPHPRIPFSPQRMPRPPFLPGHHPLDPSPSGGGTVNVKQEPSSNPAHIPNKTQPTSAPPYHPPAPPPHRFDSRHPNFPAQPPKPQYNNYPPPSGPGGNYHYGNYAPPPPATISQREEPQSYPVQQTYSEQYTEQPPAPPTTKAFTEDDSGEFGGLVSYFSSQREEELDT